jgi:hypothetical protein
VTTTSKGLGDRERRKLAAILAVLSSDYEHERAMAGVIATTFLRRHNLSWLDVAGLADSPDLALRAEAALLTADPSGVLRR